MSYVCCRLGFAWRIQKFWERGGGGGRGESTVLERVGHKKVYLLTNTIF